MAPASEPETPNETKPSSSRRTRFVKMAVFGVCGLIGLGAVATVAGSLGGGSVGPTIEPLPPARTTRPASRRTKVRLHPTVTDPAFDPTASAAPTNPPASPPASIDPQAARNDR